MGSGLQGHWEDVYRTKQPADVSWTQDVPSTSLAFIRSFKLPKSAHIIDIGGGDSKLVDFLLDEGYHNLTVLDISEHALQRARNRLGERAAQVQWVVGDVTEFSPTETYHLWHDRATFHFLTQPKQVETYLRIAQKAVSGFLTLGTFSSKGPERCSGLPVRRYNEQLLTHELAKGFSKLRCMTEDHTTPSGAKQNFLFCSFRRAA